MNYESFKKLTEYLTNSNNQNVTLSFKEIEQIIGESLSDDAKTKPKWWYNKQNNPQAHFWIDAGYQTFNCKEIPVRGNVCFEKKHLESDAKKTPGIEDERDFREQRAFVEEANWLSKVKWLNPIWNVIATAFTIIFAFVPNAPIWERFLLGGLLIVHLLFYFLPLLKNKRKVRCALLACSTFSLVLVISHFVYNEIDIIIHSDETLSMVRLSSDYGPMPIKVSDRNDTVDLYCSDIPFVFHNTSFTPYCQMEGITEMLESRIFDSVMAFARTGNPNHGQIPEWAASEPEKETTLIFDSEPRAAVNFDHRLIPAAADLRVPLHPQASQAQIQH
jgi:hypothetical protein